jgi:ketosteroid isomerase-like protein
MDPLKVAMSFVEAINSQQVEKMAGLMTRDHVFVDSDGAETAGREKMRKAWGQYFSMVPGYRIEVEETFSRGNTIVLLGTATGTFSHQGTLDPKNRWSVPAAWRVVVDGARISAWQLYVNPDPMLKIWKRLGMA